MENTPLKAVTITAATALTDVTEFIGFSIYEDAASTAQWTFRDGSATGQILASVKLAASESALVQFQNPFATPNGLWVVEDSGSITGVAYTT